MAWYSTGESAEKRLDQEEKRREEARKAAQEGYIKRWWMPVSEKGAEGPRLIFVDPLVHPEGYKIPFAYMEHNIRLNGHWRNWYSCLEGELDDDGRAMSCPLCAAGNKPSLVHAYTVVNTQSYKKRDGSVGNPNGDELVLFICKAQVENILRKNRVKRKGLRGWKVEVTRTSGEAVSTGDVFDFEERVELSDTVQPFNYMELLAPKSLEELKTILSGESQKATADDDFVRF